MTDPLYIVTFVPITVHVINNKRPSWPQMAFVRDYDYLTP